MNEYYQNITMTVETLGFDLDIDTHICIFTEMLVTFSMLLEI